MENIPKLFLLPLLIWSTVKLLESHLLMRDKKIKMTGYTLKRSNSAIFIFDSLLPEGQRLKECAPLKANSFLSEQIPFRKGLIIPTGNM